MAVGGELGIAVDRSTINRFDPTKIQMVVFGMTGPEAHVSLIVDVDGDGVIDLEDYPVWSTVVMDNVPPWSPNMPTDSDPGGGTILTRLRLFGAVGFPLTVGSYIWQAEDLGNNSVTTPFAVTATSEVE
ncbi:MAG: hypothetical protein O7F71_01285, partial [Gammaproteobacteria bacterium]|nr:hypothetical protein [Gammaproteobacteria bacterium]